MYLHSTQKLNIIVAGFIVGGPLGGLVWHHLQYVLGLHQLGYHVLFVEDSNDYPSCYNPQTHQLTTDPSYGLKFIKQVFSDHCLSNQWAYFHEPSNQWYGSTKSAIDDFIDKTTVFINLSGVNPLRDEFLKIPARIFLDTDPSFTQIRHLTEPAALLLAQKHTAYFSFGEHFGNPDSSIPDDGFAWLPTRQPVVMNAWNNTVGNESGKWTTVMQWDSYKVREYEGRAYGMKSSSFDPYITLPQLIDDSFELAIGSATAPREKLGKAGWLIADPIAITQTARSFQNYIHQSKGEWSIAKEGYVSSRCGWFSERSCGYLASGRPVVVQDTGFSDFIETGNGLFSFSSPGEATEAIKKINSNYPQHCRFAREVAEEYFRADKVLSSLLDRL